MRKLISLLFIFLPGLLLKAQTDTAYVNTYGGLQNDVCNQIEPTWDGGYIMIGTTNSFGIGNTSFYAIKTDSLCRHQWSNTYGGAINQNGLSVTPTFDKGFAFLGYTDSYGAGGYDVYLVKTDSNGKMLWQKTYGGSNWDFGYSISQTSDSGFIICGLTYSFGPGSGNLYLVRADKNGDTLWTRAIGGAGFYCVGNSVCVHEDSLYFIAGASVGFADEDTNIFLMEIDNKGILKWDTAYSFACNNAANSIRGTSDNGFVMFGYIDSIPGSSAKQRNEIMIKTDSTGKMQWIQIYYSSNIPGTGKDAIQLPNGEYLTVGTDVGGGLGGNSMHIQRLAPGGWWNSGAYFGGASDEAGNSIALHSNGNVVFAGSTESYGYGLNDMYAVRFKKDSIVANYILSIDSFHDTTLALIPAGIPNVSNGQSNVKVFPNPSVSETTVLIQSDPKQSYFLNLFDITGKSLMQNIPIHNMGNGQSKVIINKETINSGTYIYKIIDIGNDLIATGKIIIE